MSVRHDGGAVRASVWSAVACAAVVGGFVAPSAKAQKAFFSFEGEVVTAGDQFDFDINLSRAVDNTQPLAFQTFLHGGGTNAAGDTFTPPGVAPFAIDPDLRLFDSVPNEIARNDDGNQGVTGFDSLLSWAGVAPNPNGGTPIPSPLAAGDYAVNLQELGNDNTGVWALDLVGPADALSLSGVTAAGPATGVISSLKFGTIDTGMGVAPAVLNNATDLTLAGPLVVGQSGQAVFNHIGGTLTLEDFSRVGGSGLGVGTMNIDAAVNMAGFATLQAGGFGPNSDGTINLNSGGTFTGSIGAQDTGTLNVNAGGVLHATSTLVLNEGDLNLAGAGILTFAADTGMNAIDGAAVDFAQSYNIDNGTTFLFSGAATFTGNSYIDVGSGSDGTLTISGQDTVFTTNTDLATHIDWGIGGGTASINVSNLAHADFRAARIDLANDGDAGSTATLNVISAATVTTNNLALADGTAAGTAGITVSGNPTGFGPATLTQNGASTLVIGGTGTGSASVTVSTGGVFNTGTGGTDVHGNGELLVLGAQFNGNGDVTFHPDAELVVNAGTATVVGTLAFDQNTKATLSNGWTLEADAVDFLGYGGFGSSSQSINGSSDGRLRVNRIRNTDIGSGTTGFHGTLALGVDLPGTGESAATHTVSEGKLFEVRVNLVVGHTADAAFNVTAGSFGPATTNVTLGDLIVGQFPPPPPITTGDIAPLLSTGATGTVTLTGDNASGNEATLNIGGDLDLRNGTVTLNDDSTLTAAAGTVGAMGTLEMVPTDVPGFGIAQFTGDLTIENGGTLAGKTNLQAVTVHNHGTVRPEHFVDSVGNGFLMSLDADFVQYADGRIEIGTASDATAIPKVFDYLEALDATVTGQLAFTSTDPLNDYSAFTAYAFEESLILADSVSGVFTTVTGHVLSDDTALAVLYDGFGVNVQRVLFGDANLSGQIEQADLDAVLQNWGKTSTTDGISWVTGDYNGNGQVEQGDLDAVLQNWGDQLNAPDFTGYEAFAVPEPSAAVLMIMALAVWRRRAAV